MAASRPLWTIDCLVHFSQARAMAHPNIPQGHRPSTLRWTCRLSRIQTPLGSWACLPSGNTVASLTRGMSSCMSTPKGDADFNLLQSLPPGYREIQCNFAASGHTMANCCEYTAPSDKDQLGFAVKQSEDSAPRTAPPVQAPAEVPAPDAVPSPPSSSAL